MNNKLEKVTDSNIQLTSGIRQLPKTAIKVYKLIIHCIKEKRILDDALLAQWYLERIVKPRNKTVNGKYLRTERVNADKDPHWQWDRHIYEQLSEYEIKKAYYDKHGYLSQSSNMESKRILKYHLGNLAVRGYLSVMPSIKVNYELENETE